MIYDETDSETVGQTKTSLLVNVSATQLMRLEGLAGASGNGD